MKTRLIIHIVFIAALFSSCSKETPSTPPVVPPGKIAITKAQEKNIGVDTAKLMPEEEMLSLTGKISFDESQVSKVFPLVGGNVIDVPVSLGDPVRKGQLLASLRSAEISDMQSQFAVAQNNLQVAQKNLDIAEELFKSHVNSETQLFAARNEFSRAQAEVNRLQQQLAVYGASTNQDGLYNVYSPMDGYIVEKNVNSNMEIRPDNSASIFTVSSLNSVWVLADVYESDLAKITVGDEVEVTTLAYPDKVFKGKIDKIDMLLDPVSKTMKVRTILPNPDGLLKPEMFAEVKVHITHPGNVVSIPSSSIIFESNAFYVMVRKSDTLFEKRQIVPGVAKGQRTYIKSGLDGGELLVTEGSLLVANNNF